MEIRKKAINISIFNLVNSFAQFLVIIMLSRYYSKDEYGTFRQTFLPFEMLSPILSIGLTNSIFYFYHRYEDKQKLIILFLCFILLSCTSLQVLLWLGGNNLLAAYFHNPDLSYTYNFLGFFAFFSLSNNLLYSILILKEKTSTVVLWNSLANALIIALISMSIYLKLQVYWPVFIRIGCFFIVFLALITNLQLSSFIEKIRSSLLIPSIREILRYSFPIGFAAVIGTISQQLSLLIVSSSFGTDTFATYVNGAIELPFISIVTASIATASLPAMTSYCKEGKLIEALRLFKIITLVSSVILFPLFAFSFVYARDIMLILFGSKYVESHTVFRIYLCLLPIRIINYGNVLMALGKTKTLMIRSLIELIVNLVLILIFIHVLGVYGAALGTVLSVLLWTVPFNLLTISKGFQTKISKLLPYRKLFINLVITIVSVAIVNLIPIKTDLVKPLIVEVGLCFIMFSLITFVSFRYFDIIPPGTFFSRKLKRA